MPRQARLDAPGALHHIMVRGINKSIIFAGEKDKQAFLERLGLLVREGHCAIYAWALMDNHVHLLFRSGKRGISDIMRKLLTWYAQYYNRTHQRSGHLFENRYKSILCDEEEYLLALVRYIHLNPVRARIITKLEDLDHYPWTGHHCIMDKKKCSWMDTEVVLARFGEKRRKAINEYHKFMSEGMELGYVPELTGGGLIRSLGGWSQVLSQRRKGEKVETDERILGNGNFVSAVMKESEELQMRQLKLHRAGKTIHQIMEEECGRRNVSVAELKHGSRRSAVSAARMTIAFRCKDELGLPAAEIARYLGVNTSSITRAIVRIESVN
ncbi:MAG: transposase [Thermodesulfovibrionales bacterium]